jgi:hypothetical protein
VWAGVRAGDVEGIRLDFKQDSRGTKESYRIALDAALCLANTVGGSVVFGVVDDAAGPAALIGSGLDSTEVRRYVHENTRPQLLVEVVEHEFRGHRLVVLVVEADQELYCDTRGRAPHRIGTECVGMDPATQQRVREERRGFDPSAAPARDEAVDPVAVAHARRRLQASLRPERAGLAKLSDEDLLRALGVSYAGGRLLDAGHRLVGVDRVQVLYTYRESPAGEPRVVERLTGSLLVVYDRVMALVSLRRQVTPVTLPDGQQLQVEDFPELAVREACWSPRQGTHSRLDTVTSTRTITGGRGRRRRRAPTCRRRWPWTGPGRRHGWPGGTRGSGSGPRRRRRGCRAGGGHRSDRSRDVRPGSPPGESRSGCAWAYSCRRQVAVNQGRRRRAPDVDGRGSQHRCLRPPGYRALQSRWSAQSRQGEARAGYVWNAESIRLPSSRRPGPACWHLDSEWRASWRRRQRTLHGHERRYRHYGRHIPGGLGARMMGR